MSVTIAKKITLKELVIRKNKGTSERPPST